jgi:hypothetical protein
LGIAVLAFDPDNIHQMELTVRWLEALGDGRNEWRGQVTYVPTGETHYFRHWSTRFCGAVCRALNWGRANSTSNRQKSTTVSMCVR